MTSVRGLIRYSPNIIEVTNKIVERVDVWRRATDGSGRFRLKLYGDYVGQFSGSDPVQIRFDDRIVFEGWIGQGKPIALDNTHQQFYEIVGRDYSEDFFNKQLTKTGSWMLPKMYADDMIEHMLTGSFSEISFTAAGDHKYGTADTIGQIAYTDQGDEYLIEALRKIFEKVDYDFYVDEDKALQIFPIGSTGSGITLTNLANSASNNLLNLEKTEFDTYDLRNYIIARTDRIDDGWTDGNSSDFVGTGSNVLSDDYTEKEKGIGSIKCNTGSTANVKIGLEFPKHKYDYLPFNEVQEETVRFNIRYAATQSDNVLVQLILEDDGGRQIQYMQKDFEKDLWYQMTAPMGTRVKIIDYLDTSGIWRRMGQHQWQNYNDYSGDFTWKITKITWLVEHNYSYHNTSYCSYVTDFWLDNLSLPFGMLAVSQDATSQAAYGVRDYSIMAGNVRTQNELDELASGSLLKMKNPLYSLRVTALGSAGIVGGEFKWIPGFMVTVHSPGDDILNEEFRISEVHCIVTDDYIKGHDFIVEADLVPKALTISGRRLSGIPTPEIALLRELSDRVGYFEKKETIYKDYIPSLPSDAAERISVGDFSTLAESNVAWTRLYEAEKATLNARWTTGSDVQASGMESVSAKYFTLFDPPDDTAGAGEPITFVSGSLGVVGESIILAALKVSHKDASKMVEIRVYDNSGSAELASLDLNGTHFPTANVYHIFGMRVVLPANKQNLEISVRFWASVDTRSVWCDYLGIVPPNTPLGYTDVTIGETNPGAEDSSEETGGTGDSNETGGDPDPTDPGTTAAVRGAGTVVGGGSTWMPGSAVAVSASTWTILCSDTIPSINHEVLFVNSTVQRETNASLVDGLIRLSGSGKYYPISGGLRIYMSGHTNVKPRASTLVTIPKNMSGSQVYLEFFTPNNDDYKGGIEYWGHDQHTHTISGDTHEHTLVGDEHGHPLIGDEHLHIISGDEHLHTPTDPAHEH